MPLVESQRNRLYLRSNSDCIGGTFLFVYYPTLKERIQEAKTFDEENDYEWRIVFLFAKLFVIIVSTIVLVWLAIAHGDSK